MSEDNIEARARDMGWRPKEEFRGDAANWVDAQEYVRKGEEVLPLVKAENRRLQEKQDRLSTQITQLQAALAEQRTSMDALAEHSAAELKDRLTEQKRQLTAALRAAERAEDPNDEAIATLEERIEANKTAQENLAKPKPTPAPVATTPQQEVAQTPEYKEWAAKNPWFGGESAADAARTAAAMTFGRKAAAQGKSGTAFYTAVDEMMAEAFPAPTKRVDPSEEGRPSGGAGKGKDETGSFAKLPADAKAKAREQAPKFVGANKMFKTEADWFAYYTKQYNTEAV